MTIDEHTVAMASPPAPGRFDRSPGAEAVVLGSRYVLGERLGQGGMAAVFRARDTVLRRDVAVKVFHHDVEIPDSALRRSGEVTLLAGLSHPNLVTLFDAGSADGSYDYLVMELVPGTTLSARTPLPGPAVAALGAQVADALAYVHDRGIVHRDVKPANVLLDPSATTAKLTDFGVARLVEGTALTVHGTTLGTPNYLSPEQATGDPVTGASDVYSLGLVLFEALTGAKAYPGTGIEAAVARLHRDPELPAGVDPRWHDLIAAMTARDPAQRPTAVETARWLRSWDAADEQTVAFGAVGAFAAPPARAGASRRPHRRRWLVAACAGGLLGAAAVTGALLMGGSDAAPPAAPTSPAASVAPRAAATHPSTASRSTARSTTHPAAPVAARTVTRRVVVTAPAVAPPVTVSQVPPGQGKKVTGPASKGRPGGAKPGPPGKAKGKPAGHGKKKAPAPKP